MTTFNFFLVIHIISGLICLITGGISIASRKRKGMHTLFGEIYHAFFVLIFISSTIMSIMHWAESAYLLFIGIFSYALALYGYLSRKRRWKNWIAKHIGGMLGSYIAIITAILVVNGRHIPIINELPIIMVWFIPTIIGTPLIIMVTNKFTQKR
ncbi:DUF2306 domain-containing protein [Cohnella yongneupensis]|uniref:DUF2306 domain-containing protein n=1 Tax=Cohnella yongneupensis TaxID=425006 RepID=A0ABW0QXL5_9BACL